MRLKKTIALLVSATLSVTLLGGCMKEDPDTVVIGSADAGSQVWRVFEDEVQKAGIKMKVKSYGDYQILNRALSEKQLDANQFQTLMFLAEFNVASGEGLVPVGATEIVPLSLYFKGASSVEDVANFGKVAIPNDPANQSRALHVLQAAGLVELNNPDKLTHTPQDIAKDSSKVTVLTVEGSKTAQSYNEGTPAVINNTFVARAGIDPKSALYADDPQSPLAAPYINAFVTRQENQDDPKIQELIRIWHSTPVQEALQQESNGTSIPSTLDKQGMLNVLNSLESEIRSQKQS